MSQFDADALDLGVAQIDQEEPEGLVADLPGRGIWLDEWNIVEERIDSAVELVTRSVREYEKHSKISELRRSWRSCTLNAEVYRSVSPRRVDSIRHSGETPFAVGCLTGLTKHRHQVDLTSAAVHLVLNHGPRSELTNQRVFLADSVWISDDPIKLMPPMACSIVNDLELSGSRSY